MTDSREATSSPAALPKQSGEWRTIEELAAEMDSEAENISPRSGASKGCAYPALTIRSWAKRLRLLVPAAPSPQEPKAVIADHGDTK